MTRARRILPLLAVLAALAAAAPAAAAPDLGLRELTGARFPDRAFVLTLPEESVLGPDRVTVRENGEVVEDVNVVPASAAERGDFAVVLALDASHSMRGDPIRAALVAARAFAEQRGPNGLLGVLAFNSETHVLVPPTTSAEEIDAALAAVPPVAYGTHIRDAVDEGLALLAHEGAAVGSILLLSDGTDTGSAITAAALAEKARRAGVRIFTVGFASRKFDDAALASLARTTGGRYAEASSADALERVFRQLGEQLAGEYLVRYRSPAGPGTRVQVAVTVEGVEGIGVAGYATPDAPATVGPPFHRPLVERFVRSQAGMVVTSLVFALVVALGLALLVRPRPRTLRRRMSEFVSLALGERRGEPGAQGELVLARAERTIADARWWTRFREELEVARISIPAMHIAVGTLVLTLFFAWLIYVLGGTIAFVPLALAVPLLVRSLVGRRTERQRLLFAEQLPDNLHVIASALRAGHSLSGSLAVLVDDCPEPARMEFRRVVADERLGAPLDESLGVVARRMRSRDLEQVALVAALQRETGGNTAEVLDRVADTVRARFELRRLVRTLTTQGRMSRWVLSLLPVALLVLMTVINPAYVSPLYQHPVGRVLLVAAAVMVVAGSFVIKRIVDIKV